MEILAFVRSNVVGMYFKHLLCIISIICTHFPETYVGLNFFFN